VILVELAVSIPTVQRVVGSALTMVALALPMELEMPIFYVKRSSVDSLHNLALGTLLMHLGLGFVFSVRV